MKRKLDCFTAADVVLVNLVQFLEDDATNEDKIFRSKSHNTARRAIQNRHLVSHLA